MDTNTKALLVTTLATLGLFLIGMLVGWFAREVRATALARDVAATALRVEHGPRVGWATHSRAGSLVGDETNPQRVAVLWQWSVAANVGSLA